MTVAPGCLSRNASASSAVTKSPDTNSPVPSMKKQRSASPSQAMPMSAFSATTALDDVAAVLLDQRVGLVVREAAVDLEAEPRRPAGQPLEQLRRDQPAHPAAGVEDDVERLDDRRIDERHHVLDVRRRARPSSSPAPRRRRRRRQRVAGNHVADVGDARVAAQRKRLLAAPSSCRCTASGLCEAVICDAAVVAVARDGEVQHVGRDHPVVDDVGALRGRAVDERRRERRRRQPHVAADGDALRLQVGDERRADRPRGLLVDLARDRRRGRRRP